MRLTSLRYKKWGISLFGLILTFAMSTAFADSYYTSSEGNNSVNNYFTSKNGYFLPKNLQTRLTPTTPKEDNTAQTLSANSQSLGLKGPFSLTTNYNNKLGVSVQGRFTKLLSKNNAISILLAYGEKQFRANFTIAHQFSADQRLKLTYEYLRQKLPFDFASGKINQAIGQSAFGADYQINLNQGIFHSVDIFATYSKAQSKNLPSVVFQENNQTKIDLRRIAGGTEKTAGAKVGLLPTKSILVNVGASYDNVKYDTKYNTTKSNFTGVGLSLGTKILLNSKNEVQASMDRSQAADIYHVGVNHLFSHFELGVLGTYTKGLHGLMSSKSIGVTLSFPAPKSFSLSPTGSQSLLDWSSIPAVYRQQVLAIKDERIINANIADNAAFVDYAVSGEAFTPLALSEIFNYPNNVFDNINYTVAIHSLRSTPKPLSSPAAASMTHDNSLSEDMPRLNIVKTSNIDGYVEASSKIPMLASLYSPYKVTVTATGYLDGKAISTNVNNFTLKISPSKLPSWKNFTLPNALVNKAYATVNLEKDVTNPSGSPLIFSPGTNFPSWLTVSKSGQLSAKANQYPTKLGKQLIDINVHTIASGGALVPHQTSINVVPNVNGAPHWTLNHPLTVQVNSSTQFNLAQYVTNNQGAVFTHETLPQWMQLSSAGELTITSPTAIDLGSHTITVSVKNNSGTPPAVTNITIKVAPISAPTWKNFTLPQAVLDKTYPAFNLAPEVNLNGNSSSSLIFSKGTKFPSFMDLNSNGQLTITKQLTASDLGSHTVDINVKTAASGGKEIPTSTTITVAAQPTTLQWNNAGLNTYLSNQPYIVGVKVPSINSRLNGYFIGGYVSNKNGTTLNPSSLEYKITSQGNWLKNDGPLIKGGKPIEAGPTTITITVTNPKIPGDSVTSDPITLTVYKAIYWAHTPTLPDAQVNVPYTSHNLTTNIAVNPRTKTAVRFQSTDLPQNLAINAVTGVITGTIKQAGKYNFHIQAVNIYSGIIVTVPVTLTATAKPISWNQSAPKDLYTAFQEPYVSTQSGGTSTSVNLGQYLSNPSHVNVTYTESKIMKEIGLTVTPQGVLGGMVSSLGPQGKSIPATVTATANGVSKKLNITIHVDPFNGVAWVGGPYLPNATIGQNYEKLGVSLKKNLLIYGNTPSNTVVKLSFIGAPWLSVNANSVLQGTPMTAATLGTTKFRILATAYNKTTGKVINQAWSPITSITVNNSIAWTAAGYATLQSAILKAYNNNLLVAGNLIQPGYIGTSLAWILDNPGRDPITYTIVSDAGVSKWLSVKNVSGYYYLTGTPPSAGVFPFQIKATDTKTGKSVTSNKAWQLVVKSKMQAR